MSTKTVIVIGHGMVGHRFVQALRAQDTENRWRVVVLSEEPTPAYDRVALSSYVGSWDASTLALAGNGYPDDDAVEVTLGTSATGAGPAGANGDHLCGRCPALRRCGAGHRFLGLRAAG